MYIKNICKEFHLKGNIKKIKLITNGIINNTYKVYYDIDGDETKYIIQQINKNVFKQPDKLMDNITGISRHIIQKLESYDQKNSRNVLEYMKTADNVSFYVDENGDYWRCYKFIDDSVTFDSTEDLFVIEQAGKAFGQFQSLLSDYDATTLHESIPDFHNTKARFIALKDSIALNVADRVESASDEIDFLLSHEKIASTLCDSIEKNLLPIRVTHNDTKCNNVLFDEKTHEALAVIDLDTVMPGLVAYDFGDAIRCIAATCVEDERDLSKVDINMDKLKAFAKGFVSEVGKNLTENEIESLHVGILVITLELASRFLKDYLDGDIYFKINCSDHNLVRAKCQIELVKKIEEHYDEIKDIIKSFV